MPLLQVVIVLIACAVLLWLAFKYIPMDPDVKVVIKAVVMIAIVFWLLQIFGVWSALMSVHVGKP